MKAPLKVAILGTGMIGAIHFRAAKLAGATIVGVAASTEDRSRAVASCWNTRALASAEEAIRDEAVDVIHICTPNSLHHELALAALRAGKHVICEKPLAISAAQAEQLVQAAASAGRVTAVPFVYRYHPMVREARARILEGQIGKIHLLHGSYLQDWLLEPGDTNWRVDSEKGGPSRAFADIGSHWCDLIEWVTGDRFTELTAVLQTLLPERASGHRETFQSSTKQGAVQQLESVRTEDVAGLLLRTAKGVMAVLTVSQVSAGRKNRLWFEVDGSRASLVFNQEEPEKLVVGSRASSELLVRDPTRGSAEQRRLSLLPAGHAQGYAECFDAFIADTYATIQGDEREGLPTFEDGLRAARLVEAAIKSSTASRWVSI